MLPPAQLGRSRVQPHVVFALVGEESILLNTDSGQYYGLDLIGTKVWLSLAQGATERQICDELLEEFAVEPDALRADIQSILGQLAQRGLITPLPTLA